MRYPAIFEKTDNGYYVYFPDLESGFTEGDTLEEAQANTKEILNLILDDLGDEGSEIPQPSKIEVIYIEPELGTSKKV